jgi:hypothetical protein
MSAFGERAVELADRAMPEFALKVALAIFVAKLFDPFAVLPALVAGYFCRTWWQVVISAAAVGIIVVDGCVGSRRVVQPSFCL